MLTELIRFLFVIAGAMAGYQIGLKLTLPAPLNYTLTVFIFIILGAAAGYVLGGIFGRELSKLFSLAEESLKTIPTAQLIGGAGGLIVGLVIAFLLSLPVNLIEVAPVKLLLTLLLYLILSSFGLRVGLERYQEFWPAASVNLQKTNANGYLKLLDTSVIIDGRLLELFQTGFLEGELILPRFVINEVRQLADSQDSIKRARGKRALEMLNEWQRRFPQSLKILDQEYAGAGVDEKLIQMAKELKAGLVTTDYNLNRLAALEEIKVYNINDLSNAIKPVVLPGEKVTVKIIKEGKEAAQGIGYLDDGTMVVVEKGKDYLGQNIELSVTSVLQTPAGRIIFGVAS